MTADYLVKILTRNDWGGTSRKKAKALQTLAHRAFMYTTTHDSPENKIAGKIAAACDRLLKPRKRT